MRKVIKRIAIVLGALVISWVVFFHTPVGVFAFSFFAKQVAGLAQVRYTQEVTITDTHESGNTKFTVWVVSNANTVSNHQYTISLYCDDILQVQTGAVSWSAAEIPNTIKKVSLTGLNLAPYSTCEPEVRG